LRCSCLTTRTCWREMEYHHHFYADHRQSIWRHDDNALKTIVLCELYIYCWYRSSPTLILCSATVLIQYARSTHESQEAAQEAQHPILECLPSISNSLHSTRRRLHQHGTSFRVRSLAEHTFACHPSTAYSVVQRPS
jgi:hypothetical protein